MKPGRLTVGVVGAGRVGAVLASGLRAVGHEVVAASGVSEESAQRIDALLPGVPRVDPDVAAREAELVLVTVPDDALVDLVAGLEAVGAWRAGQIAVHTAGRFGLGPLAPAAARGVVPLAIHPAMTFTGTSIDLVRLRDAAFAVTAPAGALPIAQALVVEWGGEPVVIDDAARPLYHAALVHGANHVVGVLAQAATALRAAGVDDPGRVLAPLVRASVEGALAEPAGSLASLTGPVVRGDVGTLRDHIAALAGLPEVRDGYRALALLTAHEALDAGRIDQPTYVALVDALS